MIFRYEEGVYEKGHICVKEWKRLLEILFVAPEVNGNFLTFDIFLVFCHSHVFHHQMVSIFFMNIYLYVYLHTMPTLVVTTQCSYSHQQMIVNANCNM